MLEPEANHRQAPALIRPTTRDRAVQLLRAIRLNRFAAKLVYRLEGFKTANANVLEAINRAMEEVHTVVPGDYLEFGVFKGASLLHAQRLVDHLGIQDMRFFGFDSFQGLPEEPTQTRQVFYQGQYECDEDQVRRWLTEHGADWRRLQLVPGFYERTLRPEAKRELGLNRCAIAILDCDIYSSTKVALGWLDDLLAPGSIVIFDDWDAYGEAADDGQRRAMDEHARTSKWSFGMHFHYGEGLRGGQAFRVSERRADT